MNGIKGTLVALTLLSTVSCQARAINREQISSGNPRVTVELLAEWDGIKLYRVYDGAGQTIYVTDTRSGSRASWDTTHTVTAGKTHVVVTDHHATLEAR